MSLGTATAMYLLKSSLRPLHLLLPLPTIMNRILQKHYFRWQNKNLTFLIWPHQRSQFRSSLVQTVMKTLTLRTQTPHLCTTYSSIINDVTSFTQQNKVYITFVISNFHIPEVHGSYKEDALKSYLQYTRFYANPLAGAQRVDIGLFNWSPSYPLYAYEVNSVFRTGTPAFMELITSLGNTFLKANRFAASWHVPLSSESYMTFSPLSTTYHAPGSPGSYILTPSRLSRHIPTTLTYWTRLTSLETWRCIYS